LRKPHAESGGARHSGARPHTRAGIRGTRRVTAVVPCLCAPVKRLRSPTFRGAAERPPRGN